MGGSSYSRSTYSSGVGYSYSNQAKQVYRNRSSANPDVLPTNEKRLATDVKHPVIICLDVTGSMGDNTKIVYDKMPMLWGQLEQKNYLSDFAISFCAIGDAYTDEAPLQITPFEKGITIDEWLKKIWLEGNGGGQTMESYDLAALFYLTRCSIPNCEKGFFFFIGDEGYYPELDGKLVTELFDGLKDKFETYFLHLPYTSGSSSDEERIVEDWRKILGERFMILKEPKSVVDTIIGIIAMNMGVQFSVYAEDMRNRGQTEERVQNVRSTINEIESTLSVVEQKEVFHLTNRDPFRKRV